MQIVESGIPFAFNYTTFDQAIGLFVAAAVYDVSGSPFLNSVVPMGEVANGMYSGNFTGARGHSYLVISVVFTDGTYTTPASDRAPSSECYQCEGVASPTLLFTYASFNQDPTLHVAATSFDVTTGTPVFDAQIPMNPIAYGVYFGKTDAVLLHTYEVIMLIYTDSGYEIVDSGYAPATAPFQGINLSPSQSIVLLDEATLLGQSLDATLTGQCIQAELIGQSINATLEGSC